MSVVSVANDKTRLLRYVASMGIFALAFLGASCSNTPSAADSDSVQCVPAPSSYGCVKPTLASPPTTLDSNPACRSNNRYDYFLNRTANGEIRIRMTTKVGAVPRLDMVELLATLPAYYGSCIEGFTTKLSAPENRPDTLDVYFTTGADPADVAEVTAFLRAQVDFVKSVVTFGS